MVVTPTRVDLYFDPVCPFAWITSRWLLEVQRYRGGLDVRWHPMSLYLFNAGRDVDSSYRALLNQSPAAARVCVAAAREHGEAVLDGLYTAFGSALFAGEHHEVVHRPRVLTDQWAKVMRAAIDTALAETGLPAGLAAAGDATFYDDALRANQNAALGKVGSDTGTPVIHLGDTGIFGPVLTAIPRGLNAALVFDAVRLLANRPDFVELKRTLTGELSFA